MACNPNGQRGFPQADKLYGRGNARIVQTLFTNEMVERIATWVEVGYCEESSRCKLRVFALRSCLNKVRYKVTRTDGKVVSVCGTHLRGYNEYDWRHDKPIKGRFLENVLKVEDIKSGKVIYEKNGQR